MIEHSNKQVGTGRLAGGLVVLAVVLAVLAMVLSYAGRAVLSREPFADRAVAALRDPAVQDDVADHLTSVVAGAGRGDLITLRPVVRSVAGTVVASRPFARCCTRPCSVLGTQRPAVHLISHRRTSELTDATNLRPSCPPHRGSASAPLCGGSAIACLTW
jgi:hypothetical protein